MTQRKSAEDGLISFLSSMTNELGIELSESMFEATQREGVRLIRAFLSIGDPERRQRAISFVEGLAKMDSERHAS